MLMETDNLKLSASSQVNPFLKIALVTESLSSHRTLTGAHTLLGKCKWTLSELSREWLQLELVTAPKAGKAVEKVGQRGRVGIINLLHSLHIFYKINMHGQLTSQVHRWRHLLPSLATQGWPLEPTRWKERTDVHEVALWPPHACQGTSHFDYLLSFSSVISVWLFLLK